MKAKEVLNLLSISHVTLCKYIREGILKGIKTPTGQWIYGDSAYSFIGLKRANRRYQIRYVFDRKGFQYLCEEVTRGNIELIIIDEQG